MNGKPLMLTAGTAVHVLSTEEYDEGEEGVSATLYAEGLLVEARVAEPSEFYILIPIDKLLTAWAAQTAKNAN